MKVEGRGEGSDSSLNAILASKKKTQPNYENPNPWRKGGGGLIRLFLLFKALIHISNNVFNSTYFFNNQYIDLLKGGVNITMKSFLWWFVRVMKVAHCKKKPAFFCIFAYIKGGSWSEVSGQDLELLYIQYVYLFHQQSAILESIRKRYLGERALISILNSGNYHILWFHMILLSLTYPLCAPEDAWNRYK